MPASPRLPDRTEISQVIELVRGEAEAFYAGIDDRVVRHTGADDAAGAFAIPLPETGDGAIAALRELIDRGGNAVVGNAGPRFYHFVIGGTTPAALGGDWLATMFDQLAMGWVTSPLGIQLEITSLGWLRELFDLPHHHGAVMTTGAQMANFTALAAARQWWGERHGVDIAQEGWQRELPAVPILSSGYIHASTTKALAMLGIGRNAVRRFARDDVGRLDVAAMEDALRQLKGAPAILIGNAGEVNAGDFDPIADLADLAERYDAWLHVDGAFGLFARTVPEKAHLAAGAERAHSITVDGHKWLNVPYDCGFAFTRDPAPLAKTFTMFADYLPKPDDPRPVLSNFCPESSRRARALAVWSTLRAYGRHGVRTIVERHLALAQRMARLVDEAPDLERLADVPLNIVCFRYRPEDATQSQLDAINERLGTAILADGRVYAGTTRYRGAAALRPAIVNWRTRDEDIDMFVDVVRELGAHSV